MLCSRDNKDVLQLESSDDGVTWGNMVDITTMVKLPIWTFIASGPSDGLQLPSGRFLICKNREMHVSRIYTKFV